MELYWSDELNFSISYSHSSCFDDRGGERLIRRSKISHRFQLPYFHRHFHSHEMPEATSTIEMFHQQH